MNHEWHGEERTGIKELSDWCLDGWAIKELSGWPPGGGATGGIDWDGGGTSPRGDKDTTIGGVETVISDGWHKPWFGGLPSIISPFNFGVKPGTLDPYAPGPIPGTIEGVGMGIEGIPFDGWHIEGTDEFGACLGGVETI